MFCNLSTKCSFESYTGDHFLEGWGLIIRDLKSNCDANPNVHHSTVSVGNWSSLLMKHAEYLYSLEMNQSVLARMYEDANITKWWKIYGWLLANTLYYFTILRRGVGRKNNNKQQTNKNKCPFTGSTIHSKIIFFLHSTKHITPPHFEYLSPLFSIRSPFYCQVIFVTY